MDEKKKQKVRGGSTDKKKNVGFERLKRKNTARLFRQRILYTLLIILLLAVFAVGMVAIFFRVHAITVKGNKFYNDSDIISASGIEKDMNIYLIDDNSVVTSILSHFPYVRTVKVEREIPNGITLSLNCDDPNYYTEIAGEFFVLSRDLRVMQRFENKDELLSAHPDIKRLTGGTVSRAISGSELEFVNSAYSKQGKELLAVLEASEIFPGVSSIDFSDRFNVHVTYEGRLKANIGNSDEIELKLRFMNEIIKDLGEARGTIDIKDVEAAYVLLDSAGEYE